MRKSLLLLLGVLFLWAGQVNGQWSVNALETDYTIDFETTVSGVNEGIINGSGFAITPVAGQLNANAWAVTGLSDGDKDFGVENSTGDYARGTSVASNTGGLYGYEVETGNWAFGVLPGGSDLTPGTIVLKMQNNTGETIENISFSYSLWVDNWGERSQTFNGEVSLDGTTWIPIPDFAFSTPEALDAIGWTKTDFSGDGDFTIADGAFIYFRWNSDDNSGSGSRDRIAIDDIVINVSNSTSSGPLAALSLIGNDITLTWTAPIGTLDPTIVINSAPYNTDGGFFLVQLYDASDNLVTFADVFDEFSIGALNYHSGTSFRNLADFTAMQQSGIWGTAVVNDNVASGGSLRGTSLDGSLFYGVMVDGTVGTVAGVLPSTGSQSATIAYLAAATTTGVYTLKANFYAPFRPGGVSTPGFYTVAELEALVPLATISKEIDFGGGALALPFYETYETWPLENWTIEKTHATYGWESNAGTSHGPGSAYEGSLAAMFNVFNAQRANTTTMTSAVIDMDGAVNPTLSFQYWMEGDADVDLWIKAEMSTDGTTWTQVFYQAQDGNISNWTQASVILTGANATTQVRIIGSSDYGSYNLFVDDLSIMEVTCIAPTGLTLDAKTSTEATFSWTENGTTGDWNLIYGTPGFDPSSAGTTIAVDVNPYTITGLTANTEYDVYVQSICGVDDLSSMVGPNEFTTECDIVSTFPYIQEFEGAVPPSCWSELRNPTTSTYGWGTNTSGVSGKCARFNSYTNSSGNKSSLISETFDISGLFAPVLEFDYKNPTGGDFTVLLSTDGGATYPNTLQTGLTDQTNWTSFTYDLSSYISTGSNVKIALVGTSNDGYGDAYIYVDNFAVRSLSNENDILSFTLAEQKSPAVIDNSAHTVAIEVLMNTVLTALTPSIAISNYASITPASGTAQDFSVPFVYTVTSELGTPQIWTVTVTESTTQSSEKDILTFVLPGQTGPATIGANTIDIEVGWLSNLSSLTPTITISDFATISPLSNVAQNFSTPVTYTVTAEDGTTKDYLVTVTQETAPLGANCSNPFIVNVPGDLIYTHSGTTCGLGNVYNSTGSYDDGEDAIYRLDVASNTVVKITMNPGTVTSTGLFLFDGCPDTGSQIKLIGTYTASEKVITQALTAGVYYVMIDKSYSPNCFAYDLTIETVCLAPTAVQAVNLTATSADLQWTAGGFETAWNVKVNATSIIDPLTVDGDIVANASVSTAAYSIASGLTPETVYYVYVQANCGSAWTQYMFTTPSTCPVPTGLLADVVADDVTLSWNALGISDWVLNVSTTDISADPSVGGDIENNTAVTPNPEFTLTDLATETTYYWYVQSTCGSAWASGEFYVGYCVSTGTSSSYYINNFETAGGLTNISNLASGYSTNGYEDATSMVVSQYATGTVDFEASFVGSTFRLGIWIDWNNDMSFDGTDENVYLSSSYSSTYSESFEVPAGIANGDYRMRVVAYYYSTAPSPCNASGISGETEDYTFSVVDIPTCLPPTGLFADNLTATSAHLNWTENGTATNWNLKVSTSATFDPITETADIFDGVATGNPHSLTGLAENTTYYWYVQADCGGGDLSDWSERSVLMTPCVPYTVFPFFEGFESGYTDQVAIGGCWSQELVTGTNSWIANSSETTYDRTPRTGDFNAYLKYSSNTWMYYAFELTEGTSYKVELYARQNATSGADLSVSYGSSPSAASMTNPIIPQTAIISGDYQLLTGNFTPASSGTYYVGIFGEETSTPWYLSIDDFTVDILPQINQIDINNNVADVSVCQGDVEATAIAALAPQITITDTDNAEYTVNLTWTIASYDATTPAVYAATGTFELPSGVQQTNPATVLEVTTTVTVNAPIEPTFVFTTEYCLGDVANALPTTSENMYTGTWSPAVIATDVAGDADYVFTADAGQCATNPSVTVTINAPIEPTFSFDTEYCLGDVVSALPTTSDNSYTGVWSPSIVATDVAVGAVDYVFTVEAGQCATNATVPVTVHALPELTCQSDFSVTNVNPVTLTSTPAGGTHTGTGITPEGKFSANGLANDDYTITYTYTHPTTGCTNFCEFVVTTMVPLGAIAGIDINNVVEDVVVCEGTDEAAVLAMLVDSITIADGQANEYVVGVNWTIDSYDGNTAGNYDATGVFELPMEVSQTDPVTTLEVTAIITVNAPVLPTFSFDTEYCLNGFTDPLPIVSDNGYTGTWNVSIIATDVAGDVDYVFTVDPNQCATNASIPVTVHALPVVECPVGFTVTDFNPVNLTATPVGGIYSGAGITEDVFSANGMVNGEYFIAYDYTDPITGCSNFCEFAINIVFPAISDIDVNNDVVDVNVCQGDDEATAIAALVSEITIMDANDVEHVVDVVWTIDAYDANTPADYNATGTFELPAGVLQTDPATTLEVAAIVTVNAPIEPTFVFTTEYCLGDVANALPTTSENMYTGTWSPAVIATDVAGDADYVFTADAGQCATNPIITVTVNDPVVPTFDFATEYCLNDVADELPSTSENGITGTWVPATIATDVAGDVDYVFTADAGQCATGTSISVTVNDPVEPTFVFNTEYCLNDVADELPLVSENGYTGVWDVSQIATDVVGDVNYVFTADEGQCATILSVMVTVKALPEVTCPADFTVASIDAVTLTATPEGGTFDGPGVVGDMFSAIDLVDGDYIITYTYTDATTGCSNTCEFTVTVDFTSSIGVNEIAKIGVYPNPNNGMFTISFANVDGKANYQIYDAKGSIIVDKNIHTSGDTTEDVSLSLVPGVYFIKVVTANQTIVEKLVIQ